MKKKKFKFLILILIVIAIIAQFGHFPLLNFINNISMPEMNIFNSNVNSGEVKYHVKAEGNYFYFSKNGEWKKQYLCGVNIGATKPGIFPGELKITYDEYFRWFKQIGEMNINCVRVYTTQRPQFYTALFDYNKTAKNPIYLLHGIWMNEEHIASLKDVYADGSKIVKEFIKDGKDIVDVLHGNTILPPRAGFASGNYTVDVSKYVAGWIVGIEWDGEFVKNTNQFNPKNANYSGKYLYTFSASPFEAFLCRAGDELISYETGKYNTQSPISFANWITTDPLIHTHEPDVSEDMAEVNSEHIRSHNNKFLPGLFASYHIYPYYPDMLNLQPEYISYVDPYGKINPFRAYLHDLKQAHTMPIVVAEFGVPTSRALAHKSIMGYNQGAIDETEQGEMILEMMNSIYEENYAGGFIFAWQDEWFKRTWNSEKLDVADNRPFWSNYQTCEQNFGIMAFDPGTDKCVSYVDGDISEWDGNTPIIDSPDIKLYTKSDERYVYIYVNAKNFDFEKDKLIIPVDTKPDQGNSFINGSNIKFDKNADFLITIDGKNNSRITVDQYYDSFYFLYGEYYTKMIATNPTVRMPNSGNFNPMSLCFGYVMEDKNTKQLLPFKSYETGNLKFGNANPDSPDYKSLSDFIYKDGNLEIKIPWQLLNVMDPSSKKIMDDFYKMRSVIPTSAKEFYMGAGIIKNNNSTQISMSGKFTWEPWKMPTFHERLKPSYNILKNGLLKYNAG